MANKDTSQYNFTWPVETWNRISSTYGWRDVTGWPTGSTPWHDAIDISAAAGTNVLAAYDGVVERVDVNQYRGNYIVLQHADGVTTEYAHLQDTTITTGQSIKAGDIIGHVGSTGASTGPHLDFKIKVNGDTVDPLTFGGLSTSTTGGSISAGAVVEKVTDAAIDLGTTAAGMVGGKIKMDDFLKALKTHWWLVAAGLLVVAIITK